MKLGIFDMFFPPEQMTPQAWIPSPIFARIYQRHSRGWGVTLLLMGIVFLWTPCLLDACVQDQNEASGGSVSSQPWRPTFGPVNQEGNGGNVGQAAPSINLQPPNTDNRTARRDDPAQQPTVLPVGATDQEPSPPSPPSPPSLGEGARTGIAAESASPQQGVARVSRSMEQLPNSAGQVWREYDITPYTSKITNTDNPQQAIVDWIVKETGTDLWFHHPMGILNATPHQLYCYHTPEVQKLISRLVDRFVYTQGQVQKIDVTLLTVENPNWRTTAYRMMQPIGTQSPGVEAWLMSKENAAMLQGQLSRRADVKLVNSGSIFNHDGQPFVLRNQKTTQFVGSLQWFENQTPRYQPQISNVTEGYLVSISCLSGTDGLTTEAMVKCEIDQIEKLANVKIEVPGLYGNPEQANIQVPRIISWRLQERFRWSNDQVLLLSCAVVSNIDPVQGNRINIPLIANNSMGRRADALLFIDFRGGANQAAYPTANGGMVPIR